VLTADSLSSQVFAGSFRSFRQRFANHRLGVHPESETDKTRTVSQERN
jgi:hypothetical protein